MGGWGLVGGRGCGRGGSCGGGVGDEGGFGWKRYSRSGIGRMESMNDGFVLYENLGKSPVGIPV